MNEVANTPRSTAVRVQEAKGEFEYVPLASADPIKLSIAIVQRWLCKPTKSGAICTESDAMRFMMLCRARRLNPFEGDAFLVGYDGKDGPEFSLITAHQALLKRAEPQPSFKGLTSGIIVSPGWPCKPCEGEGWISTDAGMIRCPNCRGTGVHDEIDGEVLPAEQKLIGGWAHLIHSERSVPIHRRLALKAYIPSYQNKFWGSNPEGQITKCAEADCLRSAYPTLIGGMYSEGESGFAMIVQDRDVKQSTADVATLLAPRAPARALEDPRKAAAPIQQPQEEKELAQAGLAPEHPAAVPEPKRESELSAPQYAKQLGDFLLSQGINYDRFRVWATESGNLENADSIGSYDDIPEAAAKRLWSSRKGIITMLTKRGAA